MTLFMFSSISCIAEEKTVVIPSQFHGIWALDKKGCEAQFNDMRIRIGKNNIEFYESDGYVNRIDVISTNEIKIYTDMI